MRACCRAAWEKDGKHVVTTIRAIILGSNLFLHGKIDLAGYFAIIVLTLLFVS